MKLESTNVMLIANDRIKQAAIGQNGREPAFIDEENLEELRDLLNDYLEIKNYKEVICIICHSSEAYIYKNDSTDNKFFVSCPSCESRYPYFKPRIEF